VTTDLDEFQFNTMIAALIECTNELMKLRDQPVAQTSVWREGMETLTLLMAPSTPYAAEEMWSRLGKPYTVHQQSWPSYDDRLAAARTVEIPIQVNGKVRDRITVPSGTDQIAAVERARASERVQEHIAGKTIVREIFVTDRMVNFVVK